MNSTSPPFPIDKIILRYALFSSLILAFNCSYAQLSKITGEVVDSVAKPLAFANVFLNKTTLGDVANENGSFSIENVAPGSYELIGSFVGYSTYQKPIKIEPGKVYHIQIKLAAAPVRLGEIKVTSEKDRDWAKNLEMFKKVFIGTSEMSNTCKIANPWVINFESGGKKSKKNLMASATAPLEIENRGLGYRILYFLQKFRADFQQGSVSNYDFQGSMRFEKIVSPDSLMNRKWNEQRMQAYLGSYRHLFKSVIDKSIKEEGFSLFTPSQFVKEVFIPKTVYQEGTPIDPNQVRAAIYKPNLYRIEFNKWEVHYDRRVKAQSDYLVQEVSVLTTKSGYVIVDSSGILYNPDDLVRSGKMFEQRVASHLPYDFKPQKDIQSETNLIRLRDKRSILYLEEKPYIHTDRMFFHPGEKVWFKIYFNYRTPELRDTLSRVAYAELLDGIGVVQSSRILPISNGVAYGNFSLDAHLKPGDFFIQVYTNWMLNYENKSYIKPIKVFDPGVVPEISPNDSISNSAHAVTSNLKKTYAKGERVYFDLLLKDTTGRSQGGNFSISVTDISQAGVPTNEKTIADDFYFNRATAHHEGDTTYAIEEGISLNGKYLSKKKINGPKGLTVIEVKGGKMEDQVAIHTDYSGRFWLSGLQYYDTAQIGFAAFGDKKKAYKISINSKKRPHLGVIKSDLLFNVSKTNYDSKQNASTASSKKEILLKEVTVSSSRINTKAGGGDFNVPGELICKFSSVSLALQSAVPGIYIFGGKIQIGILSSFQSVDPLLIIDGVRISAVGPTNPADPGSSVVGDALLNLNPCSIDRIEVYKYGAAALFGAAGGAGVIVVHTKRGDYQVEVKTPNYFTSQKTSSSTKALDLSSFYLFKVAGYSPTEQFVPLDQKKSNSTASVGSPTIFWQPNVVIDKNTGKGSISFSAPNTSGTYRVVIEGVTSSFQPFRIVRTFRSVE